MTPAGQRAQVDALVRRADAFAASGDRLDDAIAAFAQAARLLLVDRNPWDDQRAVDLLERADRSLAGPLELRLHLAETCARTGREERASQLYADVAASEMVRTRPALHLAVLEASARIARLDLDLRCQRADARERLGLYRAAARERLELATIALEQGRLDDARLDTTHAVVLAPGDPAVVAAAARLIGELGGALPEPGPIDPSVRSVLIVSERIDLVETMRATLADLDLRALPATMSRAAGEPDMVLYDPGDRHPARARTTFLGLRERHPSARFVVVESEGVALTRADRIALSDEHISIWRAEAPLTTLVAVTLETLAGVEAARTAATKDRAVRIEEALGLAAEMRELRGRLGRIDAESEAQRASHQHQVARLEVRLQSRDRATEGLQERLAATHAELKETRREASDHIDAIRLEHERTAELERVHDETLLRLERAAIDTAEARRRGDEAERALGATGDALRAANDRLHALESKHDRETAEHDQKQRDLTEALAARTTERDESARRIQELTADHERAIVDSDERQHHVEAQLTEAAEALAARTTERDESARRIQELTADHQRATRAHNERAEALARAARVARERANRLEAESDTQRRTLADERAARRETATVHEAELESVRSALARRERFLGLGSVALAIRARPVTMTMLLVAMVTVGFRLFDRADTPAVTTRPEATSAAQPARAPQLSDAPGASVLAPRRRAAENTPDTAPAPLYPIGLAEFADIDQRHVRRQTRQGYRVTAKLRTEEDIRATYSYRAGQEGRSAEELTEDVYGSNGVLTDQFRLEHRTYIDVLVENLGLPSSFDVNSVASGFVLVRDGRRMRGVVSRWEPPRVTQERVAGQRNETVSLRLEFPTPTRRATHLEFHAPGGTPVTLVWEATP